MVAKFISPLEQFKLIVGYPIYLKAIDFSITNFSVTVFFVGLLCYFLLVYGLCFRFKLFNFSVLSYLVLNLYTFVSGILVQQAGPRGRAYLPFALTLFIFIFLSNFIGLSAIGFTLTAQLSVTAGLAFSINLGLFILGFYLHGYKFIKFFIPSGIPLLILPFLVIIEIFSYSIRSISLSVRLFANMMAGHTLLHILGSFFVVLFWSYSSEYYFLSALTFCLLLSISVLEVAIAFLQSYIFLVLFCIYLNDSISGGNHLKGLVAGLYIWLIVAS